MALTDEIQGLIEAHDRPLPVWFIRSWLGLRITRPDAIYAALGRLVKQGRIERTLRGVYRADAENAARSRENGK